MLLGTNLTNVMPSHYPTVLYKANASLTRPNTTPHYGTTHCVYAFRTMCPPPTPTTAAHHRPRTPTNTKLLSGSLKGTPDLKILLDEKILFGCEANGKFTPPMDRHFQKARSDESKYLMTLDWFMYATPSFTPGPPEKKDDGTPSVGWAAMAKDEKFSAYVPMLRRMLDCDYRSRATTNEMMRLVMEMPGLPPGPPGARAPPVIRPGAALSYEYALALGMDPDMAQAMVDQHRENMDKKKKEKKKRRKAEEAEKSVKAGAAGKAGKAGIVGKTARAGAGKAPGKGEEEGGEGGDST